MGDINQILNSAASWDIFRSDDGKEYWMVRTENGLLYNSFVEGGFVALNIPFVDSIFLSRLSSLSLSSESDIIEFIKRYLEDSVNSLNTDVTDERKELLNPFTRSLRASQIFNFVHKMHQGDIVIIPSRSANRICIGVIESNVVSHGIRQLAS